MRQFTLLIVISTILTGCATVKPPSATLYNDQTVYLATNPDSVKLFRSEPPRQFIKIGEVELASPRYSSSQGSLLATQGLLGSALMGATRDTPESFERKLREKVAEIGGDAIIILSDTFMGIDGGGRVNASSYQDSSGTVYTQGQVSGPASYGRKVTGIVIKFQ